MSNKAKHTAGEWGVAKEITQGVNHGRFSIKCDFSEIALVNPNVEEAEANARLIAAAPDGLFLAEYIANHDGMPSRETWAEMQRKAKALINKATE